MRTTDGSGRHPAIRQPLCDPRSDSISGASTNTQRASGFLDSLRKRVWWPGLTRDANTFAERCGVCWRRRINHAQDLHPSELEGVWNKLAVDMVTIEGHTCLSIIDYGSRYPEVILLGSTTTTAVIDKLMEVFARFGLPSVLVSDNGPQFVSAEMEQFL